MTEEGFGVVATGESVALQVVAIVSDEETVGLMHRTLERSPDRLSVAMDLAEGLARVASEAPDVVLVDVAMGDSAGLAVIHHVRAVAANAVVYALAGADALELGTQAVALGGAGLLMMPLSGDELLTALSDVRSRRAEQAIRRRLEREAAEARRSESLVAEVAEIAESSSRREAAKKLARLLVQHARAELSLVYLPAGEGSRQLMLAASVGQPHDPPSFCDEMGLLSYAAAHKLEVVRLSLRRAYEGFLLLGGLAQASNGHEALPLIGLVAAQAATALALIGEREQSHRGAMKDPKSSAYTFAYFVDVAGREIDKARRHGRRFALATISVDVDEGAGDHGREQSLEAIERVLAVVRDTDVLARVDENEFYLLLPETGGMGAHTCRRRVMRELSGVRSQHALQNQKPELDVLMGVATYPHDGGDLSQLLRVAKHRAAASRRSVVRRLGLERLPIAEILDALLWSISREQSSIESPHMIELPATDVIGLALNAVGQAVRGGDTWIVASQRGGVSIGAAVRSALGGDRESVRFDAVDVTGVPGCEGLEVLTMIAEHGAYSLLGRTDGGLIRAVHSADPLFADFVVQRLGDAVGVRLFD